MRPYADRMQELMIGTARREPSLRGLPLLQRREVSARRDRPAHGRPRPRRRVQRAGPAAAFALERRLRGEGKEVAGSSSARRAARRCASAATQVDGSRGPASPTGPRTPTPRRSPTGWPSSTPSDEVDRVVLVYNHVRLAARAAVIEQELLPIPEEALDRARTRTRGRRSAATSSTSPSPRRSSSGCCPPTSRPRSTARCSSRPPPSRARG